MISVTRLNGSPMWVNALLIETVEETPDTYITLTTGKKFIVLEKGPEVIGRIEQYVRSVGIIAGTKKTEPSEGQP
ncbi:flagellar FlbD family protein [Paenibacillus thiaminolyticus]|uniref:Flagellar FlbD family protein n=1 Tax=Paenibacillus thiaminolyticus TaxID=49283 RepID=A0AAP9J344_PANTH|nr:flagellar FlbD family protein [Paenibacillus thiaminolyticus]MCY9538624.1 flagellar FlbD family protein [Paenibacillus thiaminolyticus]MCY9603261.1 flagellar FlbD family protein [Paenibacillus thiaminolyticus]MCY9609764.1 flagellar FlbD family protein [Paenibacillus thiaminolyticus]MCY9613708.1 flagellar FlbD family protein [Paenibacillus thiaminolyticus]MCY9618870.1 flagellar FlbD family protein [Paenibacillus thiaminolyticus]